MKRAAGDGLGQRRRPGRNEQAGARIPLLILAVFFLGIAVSALWFYYAGGRSRTGGRATSSGAGTGSLSPSTLTILQRLSDPVEIRFYSVLDPASVSESTKAFAARVDRLLRQYEEAGNGKLTLVRHDSRSTADRDAAAADGMKPFNLDKGDACYLGLVVAQQGRKEALPRLTPDWEPALESDLSRAIASVSTPPSAARTAATSSKVDPAAIAEVKRIIPNVSEVSLAEGTQKLREAALQEFKTTAKEMNPRVEEARQRLEKASKGSTPAELDAARKQLLQVQAEQMEKLKQIAAKSKAQMEAFRQIKATAP